MGYTHYMHPQQDFTNYQWEQLVKVTRQIIDIAPCTLCDGDGTNEPTIDRDVIRFNGCERLGEDYETFVITRNKLSHFEFCKTARRPYDVVIVAILNYINRDMPDVMDISSDGAIFEDGKPDHHNERTQALALLASAEALLADGKSHWDNDPLYPVEDWQLEVANDDTRQGYKDWVAARRAEEVIEA